MVDEHTVPDSDDESGSDRVDTDATHGAAAGEEPDTELDIDAGLTAQLRALREEDAERPLEDAPLWAFDRTAPSEQAASDTDESSEAAGLAVAASALGQIREGDEPETSPQTSLVPPSEPDITEDQEQVSETPQALEPDQEEAPSAEAHHAGEALAAAAVLASESAEEQVASAEVTQAPAVELAATGWNDEDLAALEEEPEEVALDDAALAAATVPAAQPAPPMTQSAVPAGIDMGPERRGRGWIWAVAVFVLVAVAGVSLYGWWWATSRPVSVPDVVGKRPAEAVQAINDASLRLGTVSETPTSTAPPGTVINQVPAAGTQLKPDAQVDFILAAAPATAIVPDLSGTTKEVAQELLAQAKLLPYVVSSYSTTIAVDSVVAQLPLGGVELAPGSTVAVVVSKGKQPSTVVVPKVTGLNETEAVRLVNASNLSAVVYRSIDPSTSAGQATKQFPAARTSVAPQSAVQILVSQGPGTAPVTVPDVVGKTESAATKSLQKANLTASVRSVPSTTIAKGKVINQMPPAGTKSAKGGVVGLLVSSGNSPTAAVPSVVGSDEAGAKKALDTAGFTPVVIAIEIADKKPGLVFAQFPAAGAQYPLHLPVVALVAKAPTP